MTAASWNELALAHWAGSTAPAVVSIDRVVTGDELIRLAAGASRLFDEVGLTSGMAVPVLMDETPTAIALAVGGALSRRPLAPLGTKLPVDDLVAAVRGLGTGHLFASPERAELGAVVAAGAGVRLHLVDDSLEPDVALDGACGPDDVVVVVHTSGTTGRGKPVFARQAPMAARIDAYRAVMGIGPGDRFCSASPFHHTAGVAMVFTALGVGMSVIPQDWFSVEGWRLAGRLGVTFSLLVPTMIDILLAEGALADAAPRVLQYGAAPIHPGTLTEALRALPGTRFLQIFGQTEVSPVTFLSHEDHLRALAGRPELLATVGSAVPGCALRVERADSDGIGEITVRAAHAFLTDDDGWRRMGDLGAIDDEGYVTLHGRVNDRIIRGGENIYPTEIEMALLDHPAVRECAVVGIPDRRWGEIVKAVVVPTEPAAPPDCDELGRFLAERLAHFKLPAVFDFVDALPRNASGKVLRRQLR